MTARAGGPLDARVATRATGKLAEFNRAGVLSGADTHVATTLGRLSGESDPDVLLAVALAVRGVRLRSVCVRLDEARSTASADPDERGDTDDPVDLGALPWPDTAAWYAACRRSPLVAVGVDGERDRPVRLVDDLLYLDRYWRYEELVRADLAARAARTPPVVDVERLGASLRRLFTADAPDDQRLAAAAVATGWVTVVTGGPGTGKTTTVARVLALLRDVSDRPPRVALATPTAKAAARLEEAVATESRRLAEAGLPVPDPVGASTLHRLLGWRPGSRGRSGYGRGNRLPYDVVVVDETSMVPLTHMARLLDAVRPDARLVLVGDPDQLASVEAGAVLGDLVARPPRGGPDERARLLAELLPDDAVPAAVVDAELRADVVRLRTPRRYGRRIDALASAIHSGDADGVIEILREGSAEVELVETADLRAVAPSGIDAIRADVEAAGIALTTAARAGDVAEALAALGHHRVLCAHRRGPYGVARWTALIEQWLARVVDGYAAGGEWYLGRPLLVTANDHELRLYNGDTGVVVDGGDGGPRAAFARGGDPVLLPPSRLSAVETVHAMTTHRSQGSQFARVSVIVPPADSPLATRELLYTAVTRATDLVRVVGAEEAVRAAVGRPATRASGLRRARG